MTVHTMPDAHIFSPSYIGRVTMNIKGLRRTVLKYVIRIANKIKVKFRVLKIMSVQNYHIIVFNY